MGNLHKSFVQILIETKEKHNHSECPPLETKYYAYKEGKAFLCDTKQEAEAISKNIERTIVNEEESKRWNEQNRKVWQEAKNIFLGALREEFRDIPEGAYNIMYNRAYESGHSSGLDEVANYMYDEYQTYIMYKEYFEGCE
jgi:hypothetical protein